MALVAFALHFASRGKLCGWSAYRALARRGFARRFLMRKIGKDSLDPSLAIYTNVAEGPNPPPVGLASDLDCGRNPRDPRHRQLPIRAPPTA